MGFFEMGAGLSVQDPSVGSASSTPNPFPLGCPTDDQDKCLAFPSACLNMLTEKVLWEKKNQVPLDRYELAKLCDSGKGLQLTTPGPCRH